MANGDKRYELVRDNLGVVFLVDHERRYRYRVTGEGALRALEKLWGPVRTRDPKTGGPIFLTGWTEPGRAIDLYGGANQIEMVVAGHLRDPLTGRFVDNPQSITTASGIRIEAAPRRADPPRLDPEQSNARARIDDLLNTLGLGSLSKQAWQWIQQGLSDLEIVQRIRETDQYRRRFPAMEARRRAGLSAISEMDYISYERGVRQMMLEAGLPSTIVNSKDIVTDFLSRDMSLNEVKFRIEQGFERVAQQHPAVRAAFRELFGVAGDRALAAYFLNPDRALPELERAAAMAEVGGAAAVFSFAPSAGFVGELADFGLDFGSALSGFSQAAQLRQLTHTLAFERARLGEEELVSGVMGLDDEAMEAVRRRAESRVAVFQGGGGALITGEGVVGAGSAL